MQQQLTPVSLMRVRGHLRRTLNAGGRASAMRRAQVRRPKDQSRTASTNRSGRWPCAREATKGGCSMERDLEQFDDDLTPDELEASAAEALPERAAMSTLNLT